MPQRFDLFSYERHGDTLIVMPAVNRPLRAGVTVVRLGRLI